MTMAYPTTWHKPPQMIRSRGLRMALAVGAVIYLVLAISTIDVNWTRVIAGMDRAQRFITGFLQPDFTTRWRDISNGLMESLTMTFTSTVVGVLISIPIGVGAARNLAPRWIYLFCRSVIAISRALQEIIVAIFFVALFGFGAFAGFLTLTFATIGFIGKLLAEEIEEIDWGQVEAMKATGAGYFSILIYAVFPQILPRQVGLSMYQLDSNLRASAVVGIVGAGGIGGTLMNAFGRYDYDFAFAILLIIIAVILVSEGISGWVRKKIW